MSMAHIGKLQENTATLCKMAVKLSGIPDVRHPGGMCNATAHVPPPFDGVSGFAYGFQRTLLNLGLLWRGVGSDLELLQAVYDVFAKLDPTTKSLGQFGNEAALNSHQEVESTSVGHSSRPSAASTSTSGYDGSRRGTDDGGDNTGGDIWERQQSQYPISQFTCENDFTHCTQDEDHGSRRANPGIGVIGKPHKGRERTMEPYNKELLSRSFESMSIRTQFSDSSNEANVYPLHVMSYGQPSSSTNEEYGMLRCSLSTQMSYQVPYQMEGGFDINTWVNFEYLIHVEAVGMTQEIYAWHVRIFNQYYQAIELVPILSPTTRRGSFIYQSH
ncbi:hypothetical protein CK203_034746 [Vitis vinifera]|uniref:Uncharacterized protein n=1 Tax=Vitis vinifera TaxID=29760 RepID=A0A438HWJ1_VITVI|nr:hypothetical protein CK203_034746 [Vitis vinifera]